MNHTHTGLVMTTPDDTGASRYGALQPPQSLFVQGVPPGHDDLEDIGSSAVRYLERLYSGIPENSGAVTAIHWPTEQGWTHGEWRDPLDIESLIGDLRRNPTNAFIRINPVVPGIEKWRRGTKAETAFCVGVVADLDIALPGHAVREAPLLPLPPDGRAVKAILDKAGVGEPSILTWTGGGWQAKWIATVALNLAEVEANRRADDITKRFSDLLVEAGKALGWHVDKCDLARVLRPPSSLRAKKGVTPNEVELLYNTGPGYTWRHLESWLPAPKVREVRDREAIQVDHEDALVRMIAGSFDERMRNLGSMPAESGRHVKLYAEAAWAGEREDFLPGLDLEAELYSVSLDNGSVQDHGERNVRQTIEDGLDKGRQNPYCPPPLRHQSRSTPGPARQAPQEARQEPARPRFGVIEGEGRGDEETPPAAAKEDGEHSHRLTDLGNARRLVDQFGNEMRYAPELGTWLVWDGSRWAKDVTGEVMRAAKTMAESIEFEADWDGDEDEAKRVFSHCIASQGASRLRAAVSLAETEPGMPILADQLDRDPMLLNAMNCVIDLRTGEALPHSRDTFHTKRTPVVYDRNATCPLWEKFVDDVFLGRIDLIKFMQRWCGYTLTGSVAEQKLLFAHGGGANGKTTLFDTVKAGVGEYATEMAPNMLLSKDRQRHPTELMDLRGARMATTAEVGDGQQLDEALVKRLTGGDTVKARGMFENFVEFAPTHKLWLAANHLPEIDGTDNGIWRRIMLVPFEANYNPEKGGLEPDINLGEKLLGELPGILAWCVRGCVDWVENGLQVPEIVQRTTEGYRAGEDQLGRYLTDCCVEMPGAEVSAKSLRLSYETWCSDEGEHAAAQKKVGGELTRRGFERVRRNAGYVWVGLELRVDPMRSTAPRFEDRDRW